MIFRSAFWAEQKIHRNVERDHRHISRIIGHCWNKMSEEEKDVWRRKADQEKMEHELKHPGYRFSPTARTKKPVKRKVKRNGAGDLLRCEKVAELLLSGKAGEDLEEAVKSLGPPVDEELMVLASPICETSISSMPSKSDEPPFRSPLLAPASVQNSTTRHLCSPELSPAGDAFLRYSPPSSPQTSSPDQFPEYRAHIMAANQTPPSKSVLFQAPVVPPLAYSVYNVQAAACDPARQSFDLNLDPIQYVHPLAPRSPTSPYYETFAPFDRTTVPPLPAPASLANVMAEPVEWNATYAFSR
ncbi:hypothetical protein DFP72DRAFT_18927 [Ephemerocybe angulata]|uniref:HMG box domain-containing protein n=1 Tax=Ephemerocybe angulata TaxID=980116 RepID=A0A8H6MGY5_9AGAR|nr:hypothetical protein DFP72DRAFT_18927 [Tulosesus angulatus]